MIHEVSGDILLTRASAIAHSVAANDEFEEGLRSGLRGKWPMLVEDFGRYAEQCEPRPGEIWAWNGPNIRVFNLITLEGKRYQDARATLPNVESCLRRLRYELEKGEIESIALPRLATGQGRLEWPVVLQLVCNNLGDLKIPVVIYSHYQQGVQALEPEVGHQSGTQAPDRALSAG